MQLVNINNGEGDPANQFIDIVFEDTSIEETIIYLYNGIGQQVKQQQIIDRNTRLPVNTLNPGLYILTIENQTRKTSIDKKISIF